MKTSLKEDIERVVKSIRTKDERDWGLAGLRIVEENLYRENPEALERSFKAKLPPVLIRPLKEVLSRAYYLHERELSRNLFDGIESALAGLTLLRLEIVFEPTESTVERLHSWVRKEVGEGVILDFEVREEIRGGARLMFKGRYIEKTLASLISMALENKRVDIAKILI